MDTFTPAYLANLAANLTAQLLPVLGRKLQTTLKGSDSSQAIERSLHKAIVALLAQASATTPDEETVLADIFSDFLQQEDVLREVAALLRGRGWDVAELALLFEASGYEAETLPGLSFEAAMNAFAAAFLNATAAEPALQGTLQTDQLLTQTRLQRALLAEMKQLVSQLREATDIGIRAGVIEATNVVNGTQIIYEWPGTLPGGRDTLWESHYLRTLLTHCDALDLATIDEAYLPDDGTSGLQLSDVFTPLQLEYNGQPVTGRAEEPIDQALQRYLQPQPGQQTERRDDKEKHSPIPAVAAASALPRLVIIGYPGGGKSTLVNYLAAQLAARRLGQTVADEALPGWPDTARPMPVRIVLRRFAASLPSQITPDARAGLVWDYIQQQMTDWGCGESFAHLKQTLLEEGGVIFFDGLDEVRETDADSRRSDIKEAIVAFAAPLAKCRIIVTCRDYAYKRGDEWRLPEHLFPVFALARFGEEQMAHFTRTWYRQVGPLKGWTEARSQAEADKLFGAVRQYNHLRELAQYPLLLTLMAQVHGRDGFLPEDRADLYERAVKLLLAHWENRLVRDVEGGQKVEPGLVIQLGVPVATLRRALARVAFAAHERQEQEIERSDRTADIHRLYLQDELEAELGSLDKVKIVIDYIQQRAGLLQERDRYTYTFPHRTFQEYLAAVHIWQQTAVDPVLMLKELVERDPNWWREVFLLAAGIQKETPTAVGTLISELLYREPPTDAITPLQTSIALLAGQALWDTGLAEQITPDEVSRLTTIYERTRAWLLALMGSAAVPAAERAAAGHIVARLGDPRPGVGIDPATGLPDIVWGEEVPAGTYTIGGDKGAYSSFEKHQILIEQPYRLARYPITNAQFQSFIDAPDRDNPDWWAAIPERERQFSKPGWPYANHPRERVSWYQALIFCKWLTAKLHDGLLQGIPAPPDELEKYVIMLPHEYEWEVAARWPNEAVQERVYPWGPEFEPTKANTDEGGIGQTTAVGIYPAGKNAGLNLYDLSGNVWEWCRNRYDEPDGDQDPEKIDMGSSRHVVRGGSWDFSRSLARAAYRDQYHPDLRNRDYGFRVVLVRRSPSHQNDHLRRETGTCNAS
jgi:formylglycine-generating enzyme required for sulfatase activity